MNTHALSSPIGFQVESPCLQPNVFAMCKPGFCKRERRWEDKEEGGKRGGRGKGGKGEEGLIQVSSGK